MQTFVINGEIRVASGKGGARQVRAAGRTPAVLYGSGEPSLPISFDTREFDTVLRKHGGGTFILELKLAGRDGQDLKTIIKDVQRDPLTMRITHVDLQHVSLTQMVTVHVPIHLKGTAIGVKEGGILEHFVRELEVECQAGQLPEVIEFDITPYTRGQSLHVRELPAMEGVTVLTSGERVVFTIVTKAAEVEAPAAEEKAEEKVEEKAEEKPGKKEGAKGGEASKS
jgi:large subunit ribosomal protein L25